MRFLWVSLAILLPATAFAQTHHHDHGRIITKRIAAAHAKALQGTFDTMNKAMTIPYTGDPDTDFVRGMIPHHQGAVDMANVVLQYGRDPDVRALAQWIIYVQEQEIGVMKHWLNTRGTRETQNWCHPDKEAIVEYQEAHHIMHRAMAVEFSENADVDFVKSMIPHHLAAVEMARTLLAHGNNLELRELAEDIVSSQLQEVALMRLWLKNGSAPAAHSLHLSPYH